MWIKSQDGLNLVNITQTQRVVIENLPYDVGVTADGILLGVYDTQEMAKKAMFQIECSLLKGEKYLEMMTRRGFK